MARRLYGSIGKEGTAANKSSKFLEFLSNFST